MRYFMLLIRFAFDAAADAFATVAGRHAAATLLLPMLCCAIADTLVIRFRCYLLPLAAGF